MAASSHLNGTLSFSDQYEKTVTFSTPLANTNYTVILSSGVFTPLKVTNKTITGFKVQAGATLTGKVGWDLFL
jgi:hypothetical protein